MSQGKSQTTTDLRTPKRGARRYDRHGEFRVMATSDGWVMIRRPGCAPGVMPVKDWYALSGQPVEKEDKLVDAINDPRHKRPRWP